jgi:hypothetical protein
MKLHPFGRITALLGLFGCFGFHFSWAAPAPGSETLEEENLFKKTSFEVPEAIEADLERIPETAPLLPEPKSRKIVHHVTAKISGEE